MQREDPLLQDEQATPGTQVEQDNGAAAAGQAAELGGAAPQHADAGAELLAEQQQGPQAPQGQQEQNAAAEAGAQELGDGGNASAEPPPSEGGGGDAGAPPAAAAGGGGGGGEGAPAEAAAEGAAPPPAEAGPPPAEAGPAAPPAGAPAVAPAPAPKAPQAEPAAQLPPAAAQAPALNSALEVGQPNPEAADPAAASEVRGMKDEAAAQIQQAADQAVQAITADIEARRESVRQKIQAAREQAKADFQAAREGLSQQFVTVRQQVGQAFDQAATQLPAAREAAHTELDGKFDAALQAADQVIAEKSQAARELPAQLQAEAVATLQDQASRARDMGANKASGYPGDERGRVQAEAATSVANDLASEFEGKEGEVRDAVSEAVSGIGDTFSEKAGETKAKIEEGRPQAHESLDAALDAIEGQLEDMRQATLERIDESEQAMGAQIDAQEEATDAGLAAVEQQAMSSLDDGLAQGTESINAAAQDAIQQIGTALDEGATLIESGQVNGPEFAAALSEFAAGATSEAVGIFAEAPTKIAEELGKYEAELDAGLADQATQRAQGLSEVDSLIAEAATGFTDAAAQAGEQVAQAMTDAGTEHNTQVEEKLGGLNQELATGCDEAIAQSTEELTTKINEEMAGNEEALAQLNGKMTEAAEEAAWDYDHPILSAVGGVFSFIAGLVAGLVMIVAIAIVAIVALKLLVAGLVALGFSALVASIIVAVAAVVAIGYMLVQGYLAHREQGNGVFMSMLLVVGDFTGVNDIIKCFTEENASPFDRGFFLGKGIATVATLIFGGRMDKMVTNRLPAWAASPGTQAAAVADDVVDDALRGTAGAADDGADDALRGVANQADGGADDGVQRVTQAGDDAPTPTQAGDDAVDNAASRASDDAPPAQDAAPEQQPVQQGGDDVLDDAVKAGDDAPGPGQQADDLVDDGPRGSDKPGQASDDLVDEAGKAADEADTLSDEAAEQAGDDAVKQADGEGPVQQGDEVAAGAGTKDPLDMNLDELLADPNAQKQLMQQARSAFDDVYSKVDDISSRYDGAESMGGLKRNDLDGFISSVQEKVGRKGYPRIRDMGDMIRARIEADSADDVAKIVDDLREAFPDAQFDFKPNSPYPRTHVDITAPNGMRFELQVGAKSTTRFLEGAGVRLPQRLGQKVGKNPVDFHIAKYDVLDKITDDAIRARYGLDDLSTRYDQALKKTGTGQFDDATYQGLSDEITDILARMEAEDPDALLALYTKGGHGAPPPAAGAATDNAAAGAGRQGADDAVTQAGKVADDADNAGPTAKSADEGAGQQRGPESGADDALAAEAGNAGKNPMDMTLDDLLRDPAAQSRLHKQAQEAFGEVYGQIDNITSKFEGAESMGGLKRGNLDEFIASVQEKVTRKNYQRVGDMGDMIRARIEAGSGDDVSKIVDELREVFPDAVFDIKPNSPYPRVHVDLKASNGMLFELQVGTKATSQFLETAGVQLPTRLAGKVGKSPVNFHVAKYDILDKITDDALRARYGLDDLSRRYDDALRATGSGQMDEGAFKGLSDELADILQRMEAEDPDGLLALYTKGGHGTPPPAGQGADDLATKAGQQADNGADNAASKVADDADQAGAGKTPPSDEQIDELSQRLGEGIKSNPLRAKYEAEVAGLRSRLESMRAAGTDEETIARTMFQARRDLSNKYKGLTPEPLLKYIHDVNVKRYGDPLGGSFDWFLAKYKGDFSKVAEGATRPNPDVDKLLAGFRDWLKTQDAALVDDWVKAAKPPAQIQAVDFTIRALVQKAISRVKGDKVKSFMKAANKRNTPMPGSEEEEQQGGGADPDVDEEQDG